MPYLMGGFPDLDSLARDRRGLRGCRRRPGRAGRPVLGPARRRAGDPRGRHRRARGGRDACRRARRRAHARRRRSGRADVLRQPRARARVERFADELAARGISGLIVPDLPLEESGDVLAACDAAGIALVGLDRADDAGRAASRDRRAARAASSTRSRSPARRASASARPTSCRGYSRARKAHFDVPVARRLRDRHAGRRGAGGGRRRRRRDRGLAARARGCRFGAPAAAVGELVAGFAAALR